MNSAEGSRYLVGLGVVLILIGAAIGIWAVLLIHEALYHPSNIPLIGRALDAVVSASESFEVTKGPTEVVWRGSNSFRLLALAILVAAVVGSLGAIISALISGGSKVVALGRSAKNRKGEAT